jgi:3-hydroxymyristoyl/3-hydroxydecanoyl-(acyl carrier protein) dehydratase
VNCKHPSAKFTFHASRTMSYRVRAFSFVDRITELKPGVLVRGRYTLATNLDSFPFSLVAESVGQLAAWAAMAAVNFQRRPVAGLAGAIEVFAAPRPGQTLELSAELETVDHEAVAYGGSAKVDGQLAIRLNHCVGPMMPLEEFDDPQALRQRFAQLQAQGAVPGAFQHFPATALNKTSSQPGQWLRAALQVPSSAPLFEDHFPRRPVFPGTLLMHANLELASALASEFLGAPASPPASSAAPQTEPTWILQSVSDVKLRAFITPGDLLEIEARLQQVSGEVATISLQTRKDNRPIGSARASFARVP